jgi:hypothetical protein
MRSLKCLLPSTYLCLYRLLFLIITGTYGLFLALHPSFLSFLGLFCLLGIIAIFNLRALWREIIFGKIHQDWYYSEIKKVNAFELAIAFCYGAIMPNLPDGYLQSFLITIIVINLFAGIIGDLCLFFSSGESRRFE